MRCERRVYRWCLLVRVAHFPAPDKYPELRWDGEPLTGGINWSTDFVKDGRMTDMAEF
jgi:hypothetical protein